MGKKAQIATLAVLLAAAGVGVGARYFRPQSRVLRVCVFTDFAFRQQHKNWDELIRKRFSEVSRIYAEPTGVRWEVENADILDPTAQLRGLEQRRTRLNDANGPKADIWLSMTGLPIGGRQVSVYPFTHTMVLVEGPEQQTEEQKILVLAHELGHLFGVPHEEGDVLQAPNPKSGKFSARAAKLIRALRQYDFEHGVNGIDGPWRDKAMDAIAEANQGLFPNPITRAHQELASSLRVAHHTDAAKAHIQEVIKAEPNNGRARIEYAGMLRQQGQDQAAVQVLREAVEAAPNDAMLRAAFGLQLARAGSRSEGVEQVTKAVEQDPSNAQIQVALGGLLANEPGRADEALAAFDKAHEINPTLPSARAGAQAVRKSQERIQADLERFRAEVKQSPKDAEAHFNLGLAEQRTGNVEEARREFEKALTLDPKLGRAHVNLAVIDFGLGNYRGAWLHVSKATDAGATPPPRLVEALKRKMRE